MWPAPVRSSPRRAAGAQWLHFQPADQIIHPKRAQHARAVIHIALIRPNAPSGRPVGPVGPVGAQGRPRDGRFRHQIQQPRTDGRPAPGLRRSRDGRTAR